jgi:hypothetical protein
MSGRRSSRDDGSPGGCYYREFRPHPCGTLIADLVDELATVPTIALDLEDWESLCRIDQHFQVQGVCVTVLDQLEATKVKRATRREIIVVATMISSMMGTPAFSDRTEFSVITGRLRSVAGPSCYFVVRQDGYLAAALTLANSGTTPSCCIRPRASQLT